MYLSHQCQNLPGIFKNRNNVPQSIRRPFQLGKLSGTFSVEKQKAPTIEQSHTCFPFPDKCFIDSLTTAVLRKARSLSVAALNKHLEAVCSIIRCAGTSVINETITDFSPTSTSEETFRRNSSVVLIATHLGANSSYPSLCCIKLRGRAVFIF